MEMFLKNVQQDYAGSLIVTAINVSLVILSQFFILFYLMDKEPTPFFLGLSTVPALLMVLVAGISKLFQDKTIS